MHHPSRRALFTTPSIRTDAYAPTEFARVAREVFTLMGHPDADVQLEPTLADASAVRPYPSPHGPFAV